MIVGKCYVCHKAVFDRDEQDRDIEVFYCNFHYGYLSFCSEKCFDYHQQENHTSINLT